MKLSLSTSNLCDYIINQLNHIFPDHKPVSKNDLYNPLNQSLERVEFCFSKIKSSYFNNNGSTFFNHLHSDQYAMFLYFLSNSAYELECKESLCEKLFYLNKCLHGIDCFYTTTLPSIFLFIHPIGTIIGSKSIYSDYFVVTQNCTIGDNYDGRYPTFKQGVILYAGASVIGDCIIGNNVALSANSYTFKTNIPNNSMIFGHYPKLAIKSNNEDVKNKFFNLN
ncbi:MAG: hypothetical protein K9L30_04085 [Desulfobacterales bacterium]|nr:hypothetical protein [Desulfobacterales bacterium]